MVSPSQTVSGPKITGAGIVSTLAETVTEESHPRLFISVTDTVAVPELAQSTLMEVPVDDPVIVPPFTIQA